MKAKTADHFRSQLIQAEVSCETQTAKKLSMFDLTTRTEKRKKNTKTE